MKTFTHKKKGGRYNLLGRAKGAGKSKLVETLAVYRDTTTSAMYFRTMDDFTESMVEVVGVPSVTLEEALYALHLVTNCMKVPGLSGQREYAQDVLTRSGYNDGSGQVDPSMALPSQRAQGNHYPPYQD